MACCCIGNCSCFCNLVGWVCVVGIGCIVNCIVDGILCCHVGSCFGFSVLYFHAGCYCGLTGSVVETFCCWVHSSLVAVGCDCVVVCCIVMFCTGCPCSLCCSVESCNRIGCDIFGCNCVEHSDRCCVLYCFSVVLELFFVFLSDPPSWTT